MSSISKTLVLATSIAILAATDASATEYRCLKKDSSLRIAIEVGKAGHTLPCEVVAEDDRGDVAVLYSAQYDRAYCPSRIERTRGELEQEGWSCEKTSDENVVRNVERSAEDNGDLASVAAQDDAGSGGALVARNGKVIAESRQCRQGEALRRIRIEVENATSGRPCELIYWSDGDQTKEGQLLWRAEHDAAFCPKRLDVIVGKWISEGWECDASELQTVAAQPAPEAPAAWPDPAAQRAEAGDEAQADVPQADADPQLEATIAADAERIGEWMEVEPDVEVAARGDLNDDGSDDAVVLLAYQSDQSAYRQYLMSYLVADEGYELASVKLLTGVGAPPDQARVEQIDKGVIWLTVPGEGGSKAGPTGYKLQNQQLIEVETNTPADAVQE